MYFVSVYNFETNELKEYYFDSIFERDDYANSIYDYYNDDIEVCVGYGDFCVELSDYYCFR